jgi:hypothetical protein
VRHAQVQRFRHRLRLRRIDRELRRSDPELAATLAIFNQLNAAAPMPGWEQLRTPAALGWRVLLWPIASVTFLLVCAAGGGSNRARYAALACGAPLRHGPSAPGRRELLP